MLVISPLLRAIQPRLLQNTLGKRGARLQKKWLSAQVRPKSTSVHKKRMRQPQLEESRLCKKDEEEGEVQETQE